MIINPTQQTTNQRTSVPPRAVETKAEDKNAIRTGRDAVEISGAKTTESVTYAPPKKLDSEQVKAIREQLTQQQTDLLKAMAGNSINQANSWLTSMGQQGRLPGVNLGALKLPALATDPQGALAAISEGGAYSVDAVATRIFDMAKSMAGDDPEMLEKMRKAVQDGFKAAGLDFKKAMGQGLPDISHKTYAEVMKRFDERAAELNQK